VQHMKRKDVESEKSDAGHFTVDDIEHFCCNSSAAGVYRTHIFGFYAKIRSSAAAAVWWWCSVLSLMLFVVPSFRPGLLRAVAVPLADPYSLTWRRPIEKRPTTEKQPITGQTTYARTAEQELPPSHVNMAALRIGSVLILGCVLVFTANLQSAAAGGNTLVLLDNLIIKETHSIFFKSLTGEQK
jgi:hypothetical protein